MRSTGERSLGLGSVSKPHSYYKRRNRSDHPKDRLLGQARGTPDPQRLHRASWRKDRGSGVPIGILDPPLSQAFEIATRPLGKWQGLVPSPGSMPGWPKADLPCVEGDTDQSLQTRTG